MLEIIKSKDFEKEFVIDRVLQPEEAACTIIHCSYYSKEIYINGGWVRIWESTYLENPISNEKLPLLMAIGIPVGPEKHYFKKASEYFPFTLIFEKTPSNWQKFDLVEYAMGGDNGFIVRDISKNKTGVYRVKVS